MKTLNPSYRTTKQDFERGWKLFAKEFGDGQTLTQQEIYFQTLLLDAEDMHRRTGIFPTVQDVHAEWESDRQEAEQKRRLTVTTTMRHSTKETII